MTLKRLSSPALPRENNSRKHYPKPSMPAVEVAPIDLNKHRLKELTSRIEEIEEEEASDKGKPLTQEEKNIWAPEAKRLGLPVPENIKDAVKFRAIILSEERQRKMQLEREVITRCRLPTKSFDMLLMHLASTTSRELNTVRGIFEDMPEIPEATKLVLRNKAREWVEKVLTVLSTLEVDEFTLTPTGLGIRDITNANVTSTSASAAADPTDGSSEVLPTSLTAGRSESTDNTEDHSHPGRDRSAVEIRESVLTDDDEVIVDET